MVPIYDEAIRRQICTLMDQQWHDDVKARRLDAGLVNERRRFEDEKGMHAQLAHYDIYRDFGEES